MLDVCNNFVLSSSRLSKFTLLSYKILRDKAHIPNCLHITFPEKHLVESATYDLTFATSNATNEIYYPETNYI
jgi:hypothetical protein